MNFNNINHSVPFLSLSPNTLRKIHEQTLSDSTLYSYDNRLYYLSEKIKVIIPFLFKTKNILNS